MWKSNNKHYMKLTKMEYEYLKDETDILLCP